MSRLIALLSAIVLASCTTAPNPSKTPFTFVYQDLTYTGEVLLPSGQPEGLNMMIPGNGPTDFVQGNDWLGERDFLVEQSYGVAYWDKAGTGLSEGEYDHNQSIESSAEEAVAALAALDALNLPNADHLGFWSISRGGWIVPKISELFDGIDFWISVSGTIELDNSRYQLEANLRAQGRSEEEIGLLMREWDDYQRILVRGGTLEEFNAKTKNLLADPYFKGNGFVMTAESLAGIQGFFQSGAMSFDQETNLAILYPNLQGTLEQMSIPVLANLGRLDTQIDWRAVGALYQRAADKGNMKLESVYLNECNHVMQKMITGALYEELPPGASPCDGSHEAIETWLRSMTK